MEEIYNPNIELSNLVPEDKFDNHMKLARENSRESRKKAFISQNEDTCTRKSHYANIRPSIY